MRPTNSSSWPPNAATSASFDDSPRVAAAMRVDQLVELAAEREDLDELRRLADGGSQDAADVLEELTTE